MQPHQLDARIPVVGSPREKRDPLDEARATQAISAARGDLSTAVDPAEQVQRVRELLRLEQPSPVQVSKPRLRVDTLL